MVTSMPKIKDRWDDDILARDYMRKVNLTDTRIWFRYSMTVRVKANTSYTFRDNMDCRHC